MSARIPVSAREAQRRIHKLGVDGISHSDGVQCHFKKVLSNSHNDDMGGRDTDQDLETLIAIRWAFKGDIVNEYSTVGAIRGYQYASTVDVSGNDNSTIGDRFFIFSDKNHRDSDCKTDRWLIDLDRQTPQESHRNCGAHCENAGLRITQNCETPETNHTTSAGRINKSGSPGTISPVSTIIETLRRSILRH
ncbi:MAG: hypothetical protein MZV70_63750 [Desulfobacterales bacterium]|nr:hypothetical protein [Desulfobacterales bacterium]